MGSGAPGRQGHPGTLPFAGQAWSPAPPLPPPSLGVSEQQEGTGGCSRDVGLDPATLGAFAVWASLAQLIRAPQDPGWELLPSDTAGCQGGGVPLVLASHPSPPAHQYHRGILPTGVGPGQPCCLSPHPVPVPYEPK